MRIASLVLASLVIGVTAEAAYAQSAPTIYGHHGFIFITPQFTVVSDAKRTISYTDPTSGSAATALLLSGHDVFKPRKTTAMWSTELMVIDTKTFAIHAKSITISGSTPTSALGNRAAAAPNLPSNPVADETEPELPQCQVQSCLFTISNGNLFVNGIQVPGNAYTEGVPELPDAVVSVSGDDMVQISAPGLTPEVAPMILTNPMPVVTAGGGTGGGDGSGTGSGTGGGDGSGDGSGTGSGDGDGGCDDVVSAAAKLLHVQPQEIHIQPEVQPKGVQPAIDKSPVCG